MANDVAIEITNSSGQNVNVFIFGLPFAGATQDLSTAWKTYYLGPNTTEYTTYPAQSAIAVREVDPTFPPDERVTVQAAQNGQAWTFTITEQFPSLALSATPGPTHEISCGNASSKPINVELWKGSYPVLRAYQIEPSAQVSFEVPSTLWFACGLISQSDTVTTVILSSNVAEVDLATHTNLKLIVNGSNPADFSWTVETN